MCWSISAVELRRRLQHRHRIADMSDHLSHVYDVSSESIVIVIQYCKYYVRRATRRSIKAKQSRAVLAQRTHALSPHECEDDDADQSQQPLSLSIAFPPSVDGVGTADDCTESSQSSATSAISAIAFLRLPLVESGYFTLSCSTHNTDTCSPIGQR